MYIKDQVKKLTPYKPGKTVDDVKKELGLDEIIKLASNENPFGCSKKVGEELTANALNYAIYPDGGGTVLRKALTEFYQLPGDQFILGNGSDEIIQIIARAMLDSSKNTVMATPTFPQYKHNAVIEGAEVLEIPLIDGVHDLDKMAQAVNDQTAVVWVCSPNNPTGVSISDQDLKQFLNKIPNDVVIVLDEAYFEYVAADDYYDSLELIQQYPNLIVTRTFSKAYGLAGFRVGYGIAQPALIQALEPVREPFNTNSLAQLAASAALKDQDFIKYCKEQNRKGIVKFQQFCEEYGLSYFPTQGNFILIHFNRDADEMFESLMKKGIIARSGHALGYPESLRITIGSEEQVEKTLKAIKEIITQ
ncbi:histidinol-phosphate transaminase [Jeotgalibacillus haloalkalitolerans]|uniref:Histidinol-phosphate aminotransferase n=1 Tax=Jeotgalibacillus haloalkalitolerans TaxID=3104292 RepID=A0ABU5KLJ7_9BACL|nr:histidinol-phosphate transaminase [Jeotgalibacillus sp. HH7-29]MDZ5712007.1 histidinol-phosphate transaminase [Jeotgalibacillus sp. HH7-29]